MSVTVQEGSARDNRLSVLVSEGEAALITHQARSAGLSVSAFLRDKALGQDEASAEAEAMRRVDELIDRMTRDVDGAIGQIKATLARLDGK